MTDTDAPGPTTSSDPARARLDAAWKVWIDGQQAAIETVRSAQEVPRTDVDEAEGYRWVTRLASLAQEWFIEKSDPLHPQLFQSQTEYRKLLVDNPDVRYGFCTLDETRTYRLVGRRGDAAYIGLTFGTPVGKGPVGGRTGTTVQAHVDQFDLGPGGEVDILIVPAGQGGGRPNCIEMAPGTGQVAVRETFFDQRVDTPADLRVELVDEVAPPVLGVEELAEKLEFAGVFVQFVAATAVSMWHDTAHNVNRFGGTAGSEHVEAQDDEVRSHSNAEMTYHGGRWVLGEGEALVVTVHDPPTEFLYWGLTTSTAWMESLDYRYTTTNLNNRTARRSEDGDWRLVISPSDPGVPNWLDTQGRREGYMIVRWVLADNPPHPTCQLVPIASLRV
ncbi:MAG TPA: DUF1214 domain-containing protein [Acidimicrobiales bacterium]|nr:DUF1214 domain-containing protein [Acidimicrobiales bacterium]